MNIFFGIEKWKNVFWNFDQVFLLCLVVVDSLFFHFNSFGKYYWLVTGKQTDNHHQKQLPFLLCTKKPKKKQRWYLFFVSFASNSRINIIIIIIVTHTHTVCFYISVFFFILKNIMKSTNNLHCVNSVFCLFFNNDARTRRSRSINLHYYPFFGFFGFSFW